MKNIECRVSDKVNFLHPYKNPQDMQKLYSSLKEEGIGGEPVNRERFIESLIKRGVTLKQAQDQFETELLFSFLLN